MRELLILNSDLGVPHTIGARALPIADELSKRNKDFTVYCRASRNDLAYDIREVVPFGRTVMRMLTGLQVYLSRKLPTERVKNALFELFLIRKLRHENLSTIDVVHSWDFLPRAYDYIKKKNPSILIVQDVPMAMPNALKRIKQNDPFWSKQQVKLEPHAARALPLVDLFLAPSNFVKESLQAEGIGAERIAVHPFGANVKLFHPIERSYSGTFRAAFAGGVNHRKGIHYLVAAWKELKLRDAELHIYGTLYPEALKYFRDAAKHNIVVHGFSDAATVLPKNHVYVFPSLLEGSSKSIYEAMACGLPVITTPNAGSVVRDGKDGFIVAPMDADAIKHKLRYFYDNREEVKRMGRSARRRAESFTWDRYAREVVDSYRRRRR